MTIELQPRIEIVEDITYIEIVEDNTTVEVINEIVDIIEIAVQGPPGVGLPIGGNEGNLLIKNSDADHDYKFSTLTEVIGDSIIDHAKYADEAGNAATVDNKDINNYYNKDEVELITKKIIHNQGTPLDRWVITHNLSRYPNVVVTDSAGSAIEGAVQYLDLNTLSIDFSYPFIGIANIS